MERCDIDHISCIKYNVNHMTNVIEHIKGETIGVVCEITEAEKRRKDNSDNSNKNMSYAKNSEAVRVMKQDIFKDTVCLLVDTL